MLHSDVDLARLLASRELRLTPFDERLIGPASIDVCLGPTFALLDDVTEVDTLNPPPVQRVTVDRGEPIGLDPGEFILGCTAETLTLSAGLAAQLTGKSSLGRLGLEVECTAGFIDPGFSGQITLELYNKSEATLLLWPGQPIAQLLIYRTLTNAKRPYGSPGVGRYQGQSGPTGSRALPDPDLD